MAMHRRTNNPFVYVMALIITGICSFLGFRGPDWARAAVDSLREEPATPAIKDSPALARAVAAAGPHAKTRATGLKKRPARSTGKKAASNKIKTARERTESLRSSL